MEGILNLFESLWTLLGALMVLLFVVGYIIFAGMYFCRAVINSCIVSFFPAGGKYFDENNSGIGHYALCFIGGLVWTGAIFGLPAGARIVLVEVFDSDWARFDFDDGNNWPTFLLISFFVSWWSLHKLGKWQEERRGQIESNAEEQCREAAKYGDEETECELNYRYMNYDTVESVDSLLKCARVGNWEAQYYLGLCYLHGHPIGKGEAASSNTARIARDPIEAAKLFMKAAQHGRTDAQCNLGTCYLNGWGVNKDIVQAYKWYSLASKRIPFAREQRKGLGRKMNREEKAEAKRLIVEFKKQRVPVV